MTDKLKSRNGGKWTEGRFRAFVVNTLRGGFRRWGPKYVVLNAAFAGRKLNPKSKRQAGFYRCAICSKDHLRTGVQVDHINPMGSCKTWDELVDRLYCEIDNLQVLCKKCHLKKTNLDNQKNPKKPRRKRRSNTRPDA